MSALARYFNATGKRDAGYDKTPSVLTGKLEAEGIEVNYVDEVDAIPQQFRNKENTLVVYTPAIPKDHKQHHYFLDENFEIQKRIEKKFDSGRGIFVVTLKKQTA